MKPLAKKKWIKALRSGKYEQAVGSLRYENQFCCLGVLADVMGCEWKPFDEGDHVWMPFIKGKPIEGKNKYRDYASNLSKEFRQKVGLGDKAQKTLIEMNDSKDKSFREIADYIERKL